MESNDKVQKKVSHIVRWIKNYAKTHNIRSLVIGVSGGVDSACVSTLCAMTGLETVAVRLPIRQINTQNEMSRKHCEWLTDRFENVEVVEKDLTSVLESFEGCLEENEATPLSLANTRSRIRMTMLYQIASTRKGIVVGTGNKVEDYGVGFFTKYGDGGVDIAPIADLYKTEVWELGRYLKVDQRIINAKPTDGLWNDSRTDEDQLGASYEELEEAMETGKGSGLEVLQKFNSRNKHKMEPIPTFKL